MLEVEGSWQRAVDLHDTPVQFTLQWEGAQLGQVTKLTLGQDKGWRGAVALRIADGYSRRSHRGHGRLDPELPPL